MTRSPSKKQLNQPLFAPLNIEKDFALLMTATIDIQGMPKSLSNSTRTATTRLHQQFKLLHSFSSENPKNYFCRKL